MNKLFKYLFLIVFILGCLSIIGWYIYLQYRFSSFTTEVSFTESYLQAFDKPVVYIPNILALLGLVLGLVAIKGIKQNKNWGNALVLILSLLSVLALIAIFFILKHIERGYLFHSHYFKLYLFMAIPMAISSILSFISFIKTKPTKENLPN